MPRSPAHLLGMSPQTHTPAGTPQGGQFATSPRPEAGVTLVDAPLDDTTRQYLATALWSSTGDDGEPLDAEFTIADFAPEAAAAARTDMDSFLEANADLLEQARALVPSYDDEAVAHDFWLTRNGHGAGFWDRGLGSVGDELTKNAKPFGSVDAYVGDDGKVYLS